MPANEPLRDVALKTAVLLRERQGARAHLRSHIGDKGILMPISIPSWMNLQGRWGTLVIQLSAYS